MAKSEKTKAPATGDQRSVETTDRRQGARIIAAGILGALVLAFALANLGDVKVHWLITTGETPLILVIAVAFLIGVVADRLLVVRGRRRRPDS
jgi:uncharacterized integral membrane protein